MPDLDETYWRQLGERAVACKGWRWMPGMLVAAWAGRPHMVGRRWTVSTYAAADNPPHPDFRDPATVGCLLARVREVYGGDIWVQGVYGSARRFGSARRLGWKVCGLHINDKRAAGVWPTEPEALVAALEAHDG